MFNLGAVEEWELLPQSSTTVQTMSGFCRSQRSRDRVGSDQWQRTHWFSWRHAPCLWLFGYGFTNYFQMRDFISLRPLKMVSWCADMHWICRSDVSDSLLAVLHQPCSLALYNADSGAKVWKKTYTDVLLTFSIDPFDSSRIGCEHRILI